MIDPEVDRVAEVFWLALQDYMPGMMREDWENLIVRLEPDILEAIAHD